MIRIDEAMELIRSRLSARRYQHSLGTAAAARELAKIHGFDADKAYIAGILHDYAKNLAPDQLLKIADQNGLIGNTIERESPDLLHASVGACLLASELGIEDAEILNAVKSHTLGSTTMSQLDKIIFLADMVEPGRANYPELDNIRTLCRVDLDKAMLLGLDSTIRNCLDRRVLLHPRTVLARNAFLTRDLFLNKAGNYRHMI